MNIALPRSEFLAALGRVKPLANKLGLVQFVAAADGTLSLTTTDGRRHLQDRTPATVEEPGTATARAALVHDLVRLAEGADVRLRRLPHALMVACGRTRHDLAVRADEPAFPPCPELGAADLTFTLEDSLLHTLLHQTQAAASTDPTRHILHGSNVRLAGGRLEVAGCDGRRLAVASSPCPVAGTAAFILPPPTVRDLLRLLGTDPGAAAALQVRVSAPLARFQRGTLSLTTALVEGEYPDYHRIIPPADAVASLPRTDLLQALQSLELVADAVTLDFQSSQLVLRSSGTRGGERLGEATVTLPLASLRAAQGTYPVRLLLELLADAPAESLSLDQAASGIVVLRGPDNDQGTRWTAVLASVQPTPPPPASVPATPTPA